LRSCDQFAPGVRGFIGERVGKRISESSSSFVGAFSSSFRFEGGVYLEAAAFAVAFAEAFAEAFAVAGKVFIRAPFIGATTIPSHALGKRFGGVLSPLMIVKKGYQSGRINFS